MKTLKAIFTNNTIPIDITTRIEKQNYLLEAYKIISKFINICHKINIDDNNFNPKLGLYVNIWAESFKTVIFT